MVTHAGKLLRKWRVDRELTLRKMAREMGMSPANLSKVELGKSPLGAKLFQKIVALLDLNDQDQADLFRATIQDKSERYASRLK